MATRGLAVESHEPRIDREQLRRYEAALRSYVRRRAPPSDVDDLVQEALTRLLAARRGKDVVTPLAYLFRIASNLLADNARAHGRAAFETCTPEIEQSVGIAPGQEDRTHFDDLQTAYSSALAELSPRCRQVFVMRRHGDHATASIAEMLGISHRMVQKYMVQALELLSERLAPFLAGE